MAALSFSLPEDIAERLRSLAARTGRSEREIFLEAVENHLEDFEDLQAAEAASLHIREGLERTWTLEEVERELGLANQVQ